jgi:hypothetical protein
MRWPIDSSPLAEMVATCAISLLVVVGLLIFFSSSIAALTALSMPRFRSSGLRPAATYFCPSRDRLRQHGGVVVPSPAASLVFDATSFDDLRADVLHLVREFHFLRHRHAVLRHDGRAETAFERCVPWDRA